MDDRPVTFRAARRDDLPVIVRMLADDPLGALRECPDDPLPVAYERAFDAIEANPHDDVIVACADDGTVCAVLQLTVLPSLTRGGSWRAQIEGVRVAAAFRACGVGRALVGHALDRARAHGCSLAQLTTDRSRDGAKRFYEAIGFRATHDGMKLDLAP